MAHVHQPPSTSAGADLLARDAAHLIHPLHDGSLHRNARVWVRGDGAVLTDADGRKYIDALAGLWNVTAGHGRTELADAMRDQAAVLGYASGYTGSSNPRAIELAERLAAICYPSINRFFFTSGGGEATESSIKMALRFWKRRGRPDKTKYLAHHGYHGVTWPDEATGPQPLWPLSNARARLLPSLPRPYRHEVRPGAAAGVAPADELERRILEAGPRPWRCSSRSRCRERAA